MLRRIFAILLGLVVAIIVIGFLLPRSMVVERSRVIDAPPEVIFEVLEDFRHFARWSPWHAEQPDAGYRIEGRPRGEGSALVWSDEAGSGSGRLEIVRSEPTRALDMALELGDSEVDTYFRLRPAEGGQEVTWGMRSEFSTFDLTGRYVGLLMPALIGRSYADGLERLADYLAETPGQVPPVPDDIVDDSRP